MGKALNINAGITEFNGFPSLSSFNIPILDGLTYAGIFAGGAAEVEKNFAPSGRKGVVEGGAVTGYEGYCNFPSGCYLNTGLFQTLEMSMLAVFRSKDTAASLGIMGDYQGPADPGVSMFITAAQDDLAQFTIANDGGVTQPTIGLPQGESNFNLLGISIPDEAGGATEGATYFNSSGETTQANPYTRAITTTSNLLVGALPIATFQRSIDFACAFVWNKPLDATQRAEMTAWAVEHMANYDIAI